MAKKTCPKIAVQIPAWNQAEELVDCLNSLKQVKYPSLEVIVVNNGEDNTSEIVRRNFKWVTLIEEGIDLGFCKANNIGFKYCLKNNFDYILLLNGDTKIFPDTIEKLLNIMQEDKTIAIAGAKNILMENPEFMWGQYGKVTWGPMLVSTEGRFAPDLRLNGTVKDVDWVICNGCMIRCSVLREIGFFNENYWMCDEDVEWSFRARKNGYRTVYVDSASILHKGSSSTNIENKTKIFSYGYFLGRNPFLFAKEHGNVFQKIKLFFNVCFGLICRICIVSVIIIRNGIVEFITSNYKTIRNFAATIYFEAKRQNHFIRGIIDGLRGKISPDYIYIEIKRKPTSQEKQPLQKQYSNGLKDRFMRWVGF